MALETGTYIDSLVVTNPVGATDSVRTSDDHIRLLKSTIKNTFPNLATAVNPVANELNQLVGMDVSGYIKSLLAGTATTVRAIVLGGSATAATAQIVEADMATGSVDATSLAANAVTTVKLLASCVTMPKVASSAIATASVAQAGTATGNLINAARLGNTVPGVNATQFYNNGPANDTFRQNTSGKAWEVSFKVTRVSGSGGNCEVYRGTTTTAAQAAPLGRIFSGAAAGNGNSFSMIVPNNWYYKFNLGAGAGIEVTELK